MRKNLKVLILIVALSACTGDVGPQGKAGKSGVADVCGKTTTTYLGDVGGYDQAKATCPAACSGDSSARVCTVEEAVVAAQMGTLGSLSGRVVSGFADCNSFTSSDSGDVATFFDSTGPHTDSTCDTSLPFLCCK